MTKKIINILLLIMSLQLIAQTGSEQYYNAVTARNFLKFNRFLTVPTFSSIRDNTPAASFIFRNSFTGFEDSPRNYIASFSGDISEYMGAGVAVYQESVGIFKNFGAVVNYANTIEIGKESEITMGFNFLYSRRSADGKKIIANTNDPLLANYQDISVINIQPAVTYTYKNIDVGVFLENLVDFDMKKSKMVSAFAKKTFSAHARYYHAFNNSLGIFQGTKITALAIGRKVPQGFGYAANLLIDLPKAGWIKATYDNFYGISVGAGVNISNKLAIGYTYEKKQVNVTNEFGVAYKFGGKKRRVRSKRVVVVREPAKEKIVYKDTKETISQIKRLQDSINLLNRKINELPKQEIAEKTKEEPKIEEKPIEEEPKLAVRSSYKPWRKKRGVGGGTSFFVVADQFRDIKNTELAIQKIKDRGADAQYFKHPKSGSYYVYFEKFQDKEKAEELVAEINGEDKKGKLVTKEESSDNVVSRVKNAFSDKVYVIKVTFTDSQAATSSKKKRPTFITISKTADMQTGYYLVVNVFSKKSYAERNLKELNNDNIPAKYFVNPKNGYMYVYIAKSNSRQQIVNLHNNDFNNSYYLNKNIVQIK